jgi:hypothetical protein
MRQFWAWVTGFVMTMDPLRAETVFDNPIYAELRFAERLIVTCSGVLALYLGYRLFAVASARSPEVGKITTELPARLKLQIESIGPGVFFALFGTAILIYVMSSTVDVAAHDVSNSTQNIARGGLSPPPTSARNTFIRGEQSDQQNKVEVRFASTGQQPVSSHETAAKAASALEVLIRHARSGMAPATPTAIRNLNQAIDRVEPVREFLVDQALDDKGAYSFWRIYQQNQDDAGYVASLKADAINRVRSVDRILEKGAR